MARPLGEISVEERDGCVALIIRTTRRWFPWDVWTIVECDTRDEKRGYDDPTYGRAGFRPVRGMRQFFIDDITYYGRKVGTRHREDAAAKASRQALEKFLDWRSRQQAIERELAPDTGGER